MRISDWSSDVCSSDLGGNHGSCLGRLLPYYAQEAVKSFENVLAAECRAAATYYVSQVGVYSTNDLIENSSARFSEETQKIIGVDALGQFQEADRKSTRLNSSH